MFLKLEEYVTLSYLLDEELNNNSYDIQKLYCFLSIVVLGLIMHDMVSCTLGA